MAKIDSINKKILSILQNDGSITNADLARKVGLAPASTLERVRKLENSGVISSYVALVNREKVGKPVMAIMEVTMSDHSAASIKTFQDAVQEIPEILECYHVAGEKDFILKIVVADIPGYERLAVAKIAVIPNIGRVSTMFVLSTKKQLTHIPLG
jgi:DNA-binding Lrp family transcriptional regulator